MLPGKAHRSPTLLPIPGDVFQCQIEPVEGRLRASHGTLAQRSSPKSAKIIAMSNPTDHAHSQDAHGHDSHGAHEAPSALESGIPLLLLVVVLAAAGLFYTSASFPSAAVHETAQDEAKH